MEHCVWIPSQRDSRGREPLRLFDYQREDLRAFHEHQFGVVLKARQIGLSTVIGAYSLWTVLFRPGAVVLWISDGQENANKAVGMLNVMWNSLPEWLRRRAPHLESDQAGKKEWVFPDGMRSRIRAYAGTGKAGASETASLVVLDEFALVEDQDNLLRSAEPTTDAGGKLFLVSTARGGHNRFARTFRAAQRGESRYVPVFHPWMVSRFVNPLAERMAGCPACGASGLRDTPEGRVFCAECVDTSIYNAKMRDWADQPWMLSAEYPSTPEEAFRESGAPRFGSLPRERDCQSTWWRGHLDIDLGGVGRLRPDDEAPLRVDPRTAERGPDRDRDYVLFVDPARGQGGDYMAAQVLAFDDDGLPEIVAWWWSNTIEPVEAADEFDRLGRWFAGQDKRAALLAVENTGGWGDSLLVQLQVHLGYPRLYSHRPTGNRRRRRQHQLGFPMSWQRRPLVIDRLAEHVSTAKPDGPLLGGIYPELLGELETFVRREDGKVAADVGCHDDLVMSAAGGLFVLLEEVSPASDRVTGERRDSGGDTLRLTALFDQIEEARRVDGQRASQEARAVRRARSVARPRSPANGGGVRCR